MHSPVFARVSSAYVVGRSWSPGSGLGQRHSSSPSPECGHKVLPMYPLYPSTAVPATGSISHSGVYQGSLNLRQILSKSFGPPPDRGFHEGGSSRELLRRSDFPGAKVSSLVHSVALRDGVFDFPPSLEIVPMAWS